jgi:hypothetical protein
MRGLFPQQLVAVNEGKCVIEVSVKLVPLEEVWQTGSLLDSFAGDPVSFESRSVDRS